MRGPTPTRATAMAPSVTYYVPVCPYSIPAGLPEFIVLVRYVNVLEAKLRQVEEGRATSVGSSQDPIKPSTVGSATSTPDVGYPFAEDREGCEPLLQATRQAAQRRASPAHSPRPLPPVRSVPPDAEAQDRSASPLSRPLRTSMRAQRSAAPPPPQPLAVSNQSGQEMSPRAQQRVPNAEARDRLASPPVPPTPSTTRAQRSAAPPRPPYIPELPIAGGRPIVVQQKDTSPRLLIMEPHEKEMERQKRERERARLQTQDRELVHVEGRAPKQTRGKGEEEKGVGISGEQGRREKERQERERAIELERTREREVERARERERQERERVREREREEEKERLKKIESELQILREATIDAQRALPQQSPGARGEEAFSNSDVRAQESKKATRNATTSPQSDGNRSPFSPLNSPVHTRVKLRDVVHLQTIAFCGCFWCCCADLCANGKNQVDRSRRGSFSGVLFEDKTTIPSAFFETITQPKDKPNPPSSRPAPNFSVVAPPRTVLPQNTSAHQPHFLPVHGIPAPVRT